ncbi:hypothetical protein [Pseudoxanthomonas beigongshangi]
MVLDPITLKTLAIELTACMPPFHACACGGQQTANFGPTQHLREELAEMLAESALPSVEEYDAAMQAVEVVDSIAWALVRTPGLGQVGAALTQGHADRLKASAAILRSFVEGRHG